MGSVIELPLRLMLASLLILACRVSITLAMLAALSFMLMLLTCVLLTAALSELAKSDETLME